MDEKIRRAIANGLTCDITTIGRRSGKPSRIEIWYFVIDQQVYLTGTPGLRDWYANLVAEPLFTFHVKQGANADLPARATPVTEPDERQRIMGDVIRRTSYFSDGELEAWVAGSPLVVVEFLPMA